MLWAILLLVLGAQDDRVDDLVLRLGDELAAARDKAESALYQLGNAALPALRKANDHADAEIRIRVRRLTQRIQWEPWIEPIVFSQYPELKNVFEEGDPKKFLETCSHHHGWRLVVFPGLEAYLIRLLDEPDPGLRKLAISCLSLELEPFNRRRPIRAFVDCIVRWDPVADDDPDCWSLQTLSKAAFQLSSPVDLRILTGRDAPQLVANQVLQILRASLGDEREVVPLVETLKGKTTWLRKLALEAIARGHLVGIRAEVFRCLNVLELRWEAFRTLATLVDGSCREEVLAYLRNRPSGVGSWAEYRIFVQAGVREAASILIGDLGNQYERKNAAQALADLGIREAFGPICELISDPQDGHHFAGHAARLASAETVNRLLEMLEKYPIRNNFSTYYGLRSLQDPDAQRIVVKRFLDGTQRDVRKKLFFEGLGSSSFLDEAVLDEIASNVSDPNSLDAAVILFGRRGIRALPQLEKALLAAEKPRWEFVRIFEDYPSDRLVEKLGRIAEEDTSMANDVLERWATPAAKKELARLASGAKNPWVRHAAAASLAWTGGDVGDLLVHALQELDPVRQCIPRLGDLLETGHPGLREALRKQVIARGVDAYFPLLERWSDPEMIPAFKKRLSTPDVIRRDELTKAESFMGMCTEGHFPDYTGYMALKCLSATGDRSLTPLFQERLFDPSPYNRSVAIEVCGRWRMREALPALRQLVQTGAFSARGQAIAALAEIGAPGTAEFLRNHLRDNLMPAAHALARLGVDAHKEVLALLPELIEPEYGYEVIDRLANPHIYAGAFARLPKGASRRVEHFPAIVEKMTGVPCRLSVAVREATERRDLLRYDSGVPTLCDAFIWMASYSQGFRLLHVYRNGAIEICTLDEARQYWSQR